MAGADGGPVFTGFQLLPREVTLFHNADVPGSSPGVATINFKGLAQANPFLFARKKGRLKGTLCA
jgi:hypothetical protein